MHVCMYSCGMENELGCIGLPIMCICGRVRENLFVICTYVHDAIDEDDADNMSALVVSMCVCVCVCVSVCAFDIYVRIFYGGWRSK
jgi:hypothetical protein